MFKKVASLCLSTAMAVSLGFVARAEFPKPYSEEDCVRSCKELQKNEFTFWQILERLNNEKSALAEFLDYLERTQKVLKNQKLREEALNNMKSQFDEDKSKKDSTADLLKNDNVGKFFGENINIMIGPLKENIKLFDKQISNAKNASESIRRLYYQKCPSVICKRINSEEDAYNQTYTNF